MKMDANTEKDIISIDIDDTDSDSNGDNSVQSGNVTGTPEPQPDLKRVRATRNKLNTDMKFMNNFDPESSNRERRKISRKLITDGTTKRSASLYDENGILKGSGKDICDCLNPECPGCHFPCLKCRSCKCGIECRVHRKWMYEDVENEGEKAALMSSFNTLKLQEDTTIIRKIDSNK